MAGRGGKPHTWHLAHRITDGLAHLQVRDHVSLCVPCGEPGLYARVPLLARAQDQRNKACKALAAARASGPEGAEKVGVLAYVRANGLAS